MILLDKKNNYFKDIKKDILDFLENLKLKNDDNIKEIFTEYELGAFGNRKIAYVLSPLKE